MKELLLKYELSDITNSHALCRLIGMLQAKINYAKGLSKRNREEFIEILELIFELYKLGDGIK